MGKQFRIALSSLPIEDPLPASDLLRKEMLPVELLLRTTPSMPPWLLQPPIMGDFEA